MAVPPLELCFELGYQEGIEYLPSRGLPKLLLDDLKAFVQDKSLSESVESLSAAYLAAEPAGLKHEPPKTACQLAEMLSWPKDQLIITHLLSQLLKYVMEGYAPRTQIIDLTSGELAEIEEASVPALSEPDQNEAHSVTSGLSEVIPSQIAGPITRLSLREPIMMAGLLAAGFTEPFPICYPSQSNYSSDFRIHYKKISHVKKLTFFSTSDRVWVESFNINLHYNGWILKEDDGACMLVKPSVGNSRSWRGYHAWCGAEFGFTSLTIANTEPASNPETASGIEVFPKDVDPGKEFPPAAKEFASQGTVGGRYNTDSLSGTGRRREETAQQVLIKKEPRRTSTRHADMQRNQIERQTEEERWRYETPPLSSLDVVKKRRWPAQYVSPPPTPQSQKLLRRAKKIVKANKISVSQSSRHKRCSTPGLTLIGPVRTKPENAQSANLDGNNLEKSKGRPRKKARKETADTPQMPISPVSPFSLASVNRAIPEPAPKTNVTLHFFLQRKELGALPTPLAQCDTTDKFFDHAEEAWDFLTSRDGASEMAAVSVEVDGVKWPMIIPWRDPLAHQWMMETIAKAAMGRSHDLHVQVKCITK